MKTLFFMILMMLSACSMLPDNSSDGSGQNSQFILLRSSLEDYVQLLDSLCNKAGEGRETVSNKMIQQLLIGYCAYPTTSLKAISEQLSLLDKKPLTDDEKTIVAVIRWHSQRLTELEEKNASLQKEIETMIEKLTRIEKQLIRR